MASIGYNSHPVSLFIDKDVEFQNKSMRWL